MRSRDLARSLALFAAVLTAALASSASQAAGVNPAASAAGVDPALAQAACLGPAHETMATTQGTRVTCATHTRIADLPAQYLVDCSRQRGQWRCARGVLTVGLPVGSRTVLMTPRGPAFQVAVDVMRVLAEHPWHFNGRDLAQMLQGHCIVEGLGAGAFAGARDYRVRCGDRGVVVTHACAGDACRMFPARWDDA